MKMLAMVSSAFIAAVVAACVVAPPSSGGVVDHAPDPSAPARAGEPLPGLSALQLQLFEQGREAFAELDSVDGAGDTSKGLGPRFNLNSCSGCHGFPAVGGSSGLVNPEPIVGKLDGATNDVGLPFLRSDGPVIEVRFKSLMNIQGKFVSPRQADGGVHALFTITGRSDAGGCDIPQPPFRQAWNRDNVSLRIPTPVFGLGLIEAIDEATIRGNSLESMLEANTGGYGDAGGVTAGQMADKIKMYRQLGIVGRVGRGRENRSGNDGTITRFGWKAQNKSLLLFSGEAYNVEQGVTNELFPNERDGEAGALPAACKANATPEDDTRFDGSPTSEFSAVAGDLVKFELFMRLLAPPRPACDLAQSGSCSASVVRGSRVFDQVYCSACHVRQLKISAASIEAISAQKSAHLYSDLLLHRMGACQPNKDHRPRCLADDISQGEARGDEFRTAPLWGVGQRVFFLHDGRARDLPAAILAHKGPGSEANTVVSYYEKLPTAARQDLIDFLRSL